MWKWILHRHVIERAMPIARRIPELHDSFVARRLRLHRSLVQRGHGQLGLVKLVGRVQMGEMRIRRWHEWHHLTLIAGMGEWERVRRRLAAHIMNCSRNSGLVAVCLVRQQRMRHAAVQLTHECAVTLNRLKMLENGHILGATKRVVCLVGQALRHSQSLLLCFRDGDVSLPRFDCE
jgi:hypothetical protein